MSAVRMCDRCGTVFSERSDGWTSMQAQRIRRVDGRQVAAVENLDACPSCSVAEDTVQPRLALGPGAGVDRIADTLTDDDRRRILNHEG